MAPGRREREAAAYLEGIERMRSQGRVQAFASPDNERSTRLLERLGFAREGLLRSYRGAGEDRVAYAVLPGELR